MLHFCHVRSKFLNDITAHLFVMGRVFFPSNAQVLWDSTEVSAQGIWLKSCRVCLCPLWFKKHAFFLLMYDHILVALAWCGHEKCNQSLYKHAIQSMREVLLKFSRQIIRLLLRPPWHFSIHTSRHFSTNLDWVLSFQPPENHFFSSSAFPIFICIVVSTPTFWGYNLDMHAFCMQLFPPGHLL